METKNQNIIKIELELSGKFQTSLNLWGLRNGKIVKEAEGILKNMIFNRMLILVIFFRGEKYNKY